LTQGEFALVDEEDFVRLRQHVWTLTRSKHLKYGYRQSWESGGVVNNVRLHREVLRLPVGGPHVDHINGNGLDNRKSNLRVATQKQNSRNQKLSAANTSGFKGVYWHPLSQRWSAKIKVNGKVVSLGTHADPKDAAAAYNTAAKQYFGEFARLNPDVGEAPPRTGRYANNTSGFVGVSFDKINNRWRALLNVGGKMKSFGRFDTPEEAAAAVQEGRERLAKAKLP